MDELADLFSTFPTDKVRAEAERAFQRDMSNQNRNLKPLPPDPRAPGQNNTIPYPNDFDGLQAWMESMSNHSKPRYPAPKTLPCANVQVEKYSACEKPGTMACSKCKLVSYCSKECQKVHWRSHKRDCQNAMRSEDWEPIWIREGRLPSFMTDVAVEEDSMAMKKDEFAGISLWGNMPAIDVINLDYNENDAKKDFFLAFIASGDIRNVLRTVNKLPSNYSGNLKVLLNDVTLAVVCRNIVLLLILGNTSDEAMAADIALHFWYSVFMPAEYHLQICLIMTSFLQKAKDDVFQIPLGPCSSLSFCLPKEATEYFSHFISSEISVEDAQNEYDRARNAHSRRDFRDRMYAKLKPSHRVAFQEYRRFGILLPFGAMNAHFNCPNPSLFSLERKWWQTDYADPLEGWDVGSIIEKGKAHGAHAEDIYGCFYFSLSEQLRMFAHRLRTYQVSFKLLSFDARRLPSGIHENVFSEYGIPSSVRFDRIEVSNILDPNYVGLQGVLTNWSPFLAEKSGAAIVGYFMNWALFQNDGRAAKAGEHICKDILRRVMVKNKGKSHIPNFTNLSFLVDEMNVLYDNSKPFSKFLKKQGLDAVLQKTKLRLRDKHTIVPHRNMAPLQGPPSALPEFSNDEDWYNYTKLTCHTWSERFVEFERT